jgi:hypothetical protein
MRTICTIFLSHTKVRQCSKSNVRLGQPAMLPQKICICAEPDASRVELVANHVCRVVAAVMPAVVRVTALRPTQSGKKSSGMAGIGAGNIVDPLGFVGTNKH